MSVACSLHVDARKSIVCLSDVCYSCIQLAQTWLASVSPADLLGELVCLFAVKEKEPIIHHLSIATLSALTSLGVCEVVDR